MIEALGKGVGWVLFHSYEFYISEPYCDATSILFAPHYWILLRVSFAQPWPLFNSFILKHYAPSLLILFGDTFTFTFTLHRVIVLVCLSHFSSLLGIN